MATHDYDIANQSGAAFRTDLNNALAAIQSNNSNSSSPATTVAYQWWADTTDNVLKIRNSANNAWVELFQLDGTLTLEDGNASTPALAFRDDLNTGIFSSGNDIFNIATGGVERFELSAGSAIFNEDGADCDFRVEGDTEANLFFVNAGLDFIGINESVPLAKLHIKVADSGASAFTHCALFIEDSDQTFIDIMSGTTGKGGINFGDSGGSQRGVIEYDHTNDFMKFNVNNAERVRIDSSGDIIVGHTAAITTSASVTKRLQILGANFETASALIARFNNGANGPCLGFGLSRTSTIGGNAVVSDGDELAKIRFYANDGNNFDNWGAEILVTVDGTAGSDDVPARIVFKTTADGAASPSERMTIKPDGDVGIGTASPVSSLHLHTDDATFTISNSDGVNQADAGLIRIVEQTQFFQGAFIHYDGNTNKLNIGTHGSQDTNTANDQTDIEIDRSTGVVVLNRGGSARLATSNAGVTVTGTVTETSDIAFKKDIKPLTNTLDKIKKLTGYKYNFKASEIASMGVIAQDVEKVFPEIVHGEEGEKTLQYSGLIGVLVEAVKELSAKVETLEAA